MILAARFRKSVILSVLMIVSAEEVTQGQSMADSIAIIAADAKGRVGVYGWDLEGNKHVGLREQEHFPMLSVYKFPLALYLLDQVDKGKLTLDEPIEVRKKDWARMRSPLLEKYKGSRFTISIRDVLIATVGSSDNVGCDLLFRLAGGPAVVNEFIHQLGIADIQIRFTEMEMAAQWDRQYQNWCTPYSIGLLLKRFLGGGLLSTTGTQMLWNWMTESTSPKRIGALLPAGTVVAHKTGTSNTNAAGITAGTNDVGIVTLPNGHHLVLAVFVSDASADAPTREGIISRIGLYLFGQFGAR